MLKKYFFLLDGMYESSSIYSNFMYVRTDGNDDEEMERVAGGLSEYENGNERVVCAPKK